MTRGKRFERIMRQKGYNPNSLAKESGVAYTTIRSMIERDLKNASIDNVIKISKTLGVSADYLTDEESKAENLIHLKEMVPIPILGTISCGEPITAEENVEGYQYEPSEGLPQGELFFLQTKGASMEPTIPENSMVLIKHQSEVESGEIAAVLLNGDTEATLKRIRKQGNSILLMPDNPTYEPIIVNKENPARIVGKALRVAYEL